MLRAGSRFEDLYRSGARRRVGGLVVVSGPGRPGPPEVGIVAGRRVGNAVRRNRAKRRLREAAAQVRLQPGTAYVLIAGPEAADVPFSRLVGWLERAVSAESGAGEEDG